MTTLQPSRFTPCDRHPDQQVTGFCAACLRERLAGLDQLNESRRKSTSSTGNPLKAIFRTGDSKNKPSSSSSFFPELRRCKSFSGPRAEAFSGIFEPQRKSCDVRARNTLSTLFHLDDKNRVGRETCSEIAVEARNVGPSNIPEPEIRVSEPLVAEEFHEIEELEEEIEEEIEEAIEEVIEEDTEEKIDEEEEEEEEEGKTIKDHIDLDSMRKTEKEKRDLKEIAGSFWLAASVFSKKLQNWRRKQKMKKSRDKSSAAGEIEKPALSSRRFRETQSEVADYGFGRRSCDTDPRFSLDAGRISFDDGRYSFDEPRASWDGYLVGGRVSRLPPMLSVLEDPPAPVTRSDTHIPVEEARNSVSEDPTTPGGTLQTREYYSDSSSANRRRRLERSTSTRKGSDADEVKSVSNMKVCPASMEYINGSKECINGSKECINGSKLGSAAVDQDLKDSISHSNSLRDDCWESFDSVYRDATGAHRKSKKSRRWSMAWSIWGLIHRRSKEDDDERSCRASVIDRSFSESWPELRRDASRDSKGGYNRKVFRCNSSVSSRGSFSNGPAFGAIRSTTETNGNSKKKREEFVLERNRSARYSPSHFDNGLLRFYLTPLRSSRKNGIGVSRTGRSKSSHSFARNLLRLY